MKKKKEIRNCEFLSSVSIQYFGAIVCIIYCFVFLTCFSIYAQATKGLTIEGRINGLKTGSKLLLVIKRGDKIDTIAYSIARDELFCFKNIKLPQYPDFYLVTIQSEFVNDLKLFLNMGEDIKIVGDLKKWPSLIVSGSKTHKDYLTYLKYDERANWVIDSLFNSAGGAEANQEAVRMAKMPFIRDFPESFVLPYALLFWKDAEGKDLHPAYIRPHFDRLPESVKNSYYGMKLSHSLEKAEAINTFKPGDLFPRISVRDEMGKVKTVAELIKKNRLTLIDCWSSDCFGCRASFPKVEKMLSKFKGQGFGVIGISSDRDLAAWKKALAHDKTSWPDYIQDNLSLTKKFSLLGKGAYFLLDSEGKMIAFDGASETVKTFGCSMIGISEELDRKLTELLGASK